MLPVKGRINFDEPSESTMNDGGSRYLTIALSVKASGYPDRFKWADENGFALEYTPDPLSPELISEQVKPFVGKGIPVRFHTRFFGYELGNGDYDKAAEALKVHMSTIEAMAGIGEPVITVHLNLSQSIPFNSRTAVANLKELTMYAKEKDITVCLENLKKGPTSDPDNIVAWAEEAGSMITMDMGHAVSSEYVRSGKGTVLEIIDKFRSRLREIHMYAREEDRHHPFEDISGMENIIDTLLETECRWWTIELDDVREAFDTRKLLLDYINDKK